MTPVRFPKGGIHCRASQLEQLMAGLILLIGFVVRTYHLGFSELIGDEGFSYLLTRPTYAEIIAQVLAMGEPHPLGSYFISWIASGMART